MWSTMKMEPLAKVDMLHWIFDLSFAYYFNNFKANIDFLRREKFPAY